MKKIVLSLFVFQSFIFLAQTTDANGKKQGYWKKKDDKTNKLIYEGQFKDNKPVGKFKYYYPNDSVRAIMNFRKDGLTSYAKLFHLSGKRMAEGKYVNEIKDSTWIYYDESGTLISTEKYVKGKKEGTAYVYLPEGTISEERNYKQDIQHGPFKQYFDSKTLKGQGNYVNGQLEGKVVYYYPNGTEVAAGYYKNGLKNGVWIYREENGKIKEKELFKNGKLASKKETDDFFAKNKVQESTLKSEEKKTELKQKK
jgi:antitoxin component YwqK of YwqJK toxin-antitoxin module